MFKLMVLVMFISVLFTGCGEEATDSSGVDTVYLNGGGVGDLSDTLYIVTDYEATIYKAKGLDTIGNYVSQIKDSDLKNGIGVEMLIATEEFQSVAVFGVIMDGEYEVKFSSSIIVNGHGAEYGYYYNPVARKWESRLMSEVFEKQNEDNSIL